MSEDLTVKSNVVGGIATGIETRAVYYYDKQKVFRGLIGPRYRFKVPKGQSAINVSKLGNLALESHTEATASEANTYATTYRVLTPVTLSNTAVVSWEASDGSAIGIMDMLGESAAMAWASAEDDLATYSFAAAYTEACNTAPDHEIGTDAVALTAAIGRQGEALLRTAGCKGPYNWVVDPIQQEELMRDPEARQSFRDNSARGLAYAAGTGVALDRYMGMIGNVHVWIGNAMVESSGLHSIMFGDGAFGQAYKTISTPLSPVESEMNVDVQWDGRKIANEVTFTISQHNEGICQQSSTYATTNTFCVDIIS